MKLRNIITAIGIIAISSCLGLIANNQTKALDDEQLDRFSANNIMFYDPTCDDKCDTGTAGLLPGDSNAELVWNAFVKANIPNVSNNPAVLSALVANCMAESGCEPFTHSSGSDYWGLFQTLTGALAGPLQERGISMSDPAWGYPAGETTKEKKEACIAAQIDALQENDNFKLFVSNLDNVDHKSGVEGAKSYAELFTVTYERCVCAEKFIGSWSGVMANACNPPNLLEDSRVKGVVSDMYGSADYSHKYNYQIVSKRRDFAAEFYEKFSGATTSVSSSSSNDGSNVTIIGDSISENSTPQYQEMLPNADLYVKCSKNFGSATDDSSITGGDFSTTGGCKDTFDFSPSNVNWSGIHVLKYLIDNNRVRDILVFELGTNGGTGVSSESIKYIMNLVGPSRKVVFVTNYTLKADYTTNNNTIKQAAADYPGRVIVADWASIASADPTLFSDDGIHPTYDGDARGDRTFVEMIRDAILKAGGTSGNCTGGNDAGTTGSALADVAKQLAWPEDQKQNGINGRGTDDYNAAAMKHGGSFTAAGAPYYSCSRSISLFILESGVDEEFANRTATAGGGHNHMSSDVLIPYFESSENWEKVSTYSGSGYEELRAGDVLYQSSGYHVFMYVGDGYVVEAGDYGTKQVAPILHKWVGQGGQPDAIMVDNNGHGMYNDGAVAYRLTKNAGSGLASTVGSGSGTSVSGASRTGRSMNAITAKAYELSWPIGEDDTQAPNSAYAAAIAKNNIASYSADHNFQIGKSCNAFVLTVMLDSGVDPDFQPGFDSFLDYMASNDAYEEVPLKEAQSGDIRILYNSEAAFRTGGGHIEIVVADENGELQISSASAGERYGGIKGYYTQSGHYSTIRVFRNKRAGTASASNRNVCEKGGSSNRGLKEGGYASAEEAREALKDMYDNDPLTVLGAYLVSTPTGDKHDNCVAFSKWFMFTLTPMNDPTVTDDGRALAQTFYQRYKDEYDLQTSDTPIVYSLASWSKPIPHMTGTGNHTGIVVGINNGKVIVAQAGYGVAGGAYFTEHDVSILSGANCFYVDITPFLKGNLKL